MEARSERNIDPGSKPLKSVGELISISLSIQAPRRPLAPSISGLADFGAAIWPRAAFKPELRGDIDLPLAMETFRGSRTRRVDVTLDGSQSLSLALAEVGDALIGDDKDLFRKSDGDEDVANFGKLGFGTGRGFKHLSSGFIVQYSELAELTLPSRLRLPEPI